MKARSKLFGRTIAPLALAMALMGTALADTIDTPGNSASADLTINAAPATFSVTVPTSLPITVDATGNALGSDSLYITNLGHGMVKVTDVAVQGQNGWSIETYDSFNVASTPTNSTKIAMVINGDKTDANDANNFVFNEANWPSMMGAGHVDAQSNPDDRILITYNDAKVPAQDHAIAAQTVAQVTFTVAWDTATVAVTGVNLNSNAYNFTTLNDTYQLTANVMPANASNQSVTWESDNEAVATVDANGLVTAIGNGSANITARTADGGYSDTCAITVNAG